MKLDVKEPIKTGGSRGVFKINNLLEDKIRVFKRGDNVKFTENDTRMIIDIIHTPETVIVCRTQDEANSLLSILNSQGIRWASGDSCLDHTNWESYEESTEYNLVGNYLKFGSIAWAEENGYTIIYFEDIFATRVSLLDILLT